MNTIKLIKASAGSGKTFHLMGRLSECIASGTKPEGLLATTFTVKAAAEAAGMSKPSSGQIQYIDLSGADSVEVYAAGGAAALNGFAEKAESLWAYVLEYFR